MEELRISPDAVKKAARECPEAKKVLATLFPTVFEDEKYFDFSNTSEWILEKNAFPKGFPNDGIKIRTDGEFAGKGFFLSREINWEIVTDSIGYLVLLPTKKQ